MLYASSVLTDYASALPFAFDLVFPPREDRGAEWELLWKHFGHPAALQRCDPETPVGIEERVIVQALVGIGTLGATVPAFFWSNETFFQAAAQTMHERTKHTLEAIYASTSRFRNHLTGDTQDLMFVGHLPITFPFAGPEAPFKRPTTVFPHIPYYIAFYEPAWSTDAVYDLVKRGTAVDEIMFSIGPPSWGQPQQEGDLDRVLLDEGHAREEQFVMNASPPGYQPNIPSTQLPRYVDLVAEPSRTELECTVLDRDYVPTYTAANKRHGPPIQSHALRVDLRQIFATRRAVVHSIVSVGTLIRGLPRGFADQVRNALFGLPCIAKDPSLAPLLRVVADNFCTVLFSVCRWAFLGEWAQCREAGIRLAHALIPWRSAVWRILTTGLAMFLQPPDSGDDDIPCSLTWSLAVLVAHMPGFEALLGQIAWRIQLDADRFFERRWCQEPATSDTSLIGLKLIGRGLPANFVRVIRTTYLTTALKHGLAQLDERWAQGNFECADILSLAAHVEAWSKKHGEVNCAVHAMVRQVRDAVTHPSLPAAARFSYDAEKDIKDAVLSTTALYTDMSTDKMTEWTWSVIEEIEMVVNLHQQGLVNIDWLNECLGTNDFSQAVAMS